MLLISLGCNCKIKIDETAVITRRFLLVHGRKDVEISGREQEAPDDEDALKDKDHVAEVVEEADGDVDAEAEQKVAAAEDAQRGGRLKRWRDEFDLKTNFSN